MSDSTTPKICKKCGTEKVFYGTYWRCLSCKRATNRQWKENHKEEQNQKTREWRTKNPDKTAEQNKRWRKENPYQSNLIKERRRTRKRNLPNTFTIQDWNRCLDYFYHQCAVCGRQASPTISLTPDHWIALSDKRPDNPGTVASNIVPLCYGAGGCNNRKNNSDVHEWLDKEFGTVIAAEIITRVEAYFIQLKHA